MSQEFSELQRRIRRLRSIHQEAFCTFNVYEQLNELRAPNIVGDKKAYENAQLMTGYTGFFSVSEMALNLTFLISLAKLFDGHRDALHISKLINYAEQNQQKLTADDFKEFNEDRQYVDELVQRYEGIKRDALVDIGSRLAAVQPILQKLKDHRDKSLAHEDLHRTAAGEAITYAEVTELLDLSHDILNLLSSSTNHETTSYSMLKRQSVDDTKRLLVDLEELDKARRA